MDMLWVWALVAWVVCGFTAYGFSMAYCHSDLFEPCEFDEDEDECFTISFIIGLFGPLGLALVIYERAYKYGFRLW